MQWLKLSILGSDQTMVGLVQKLLNECNAKKTNSKIEKNSMTMFTTLTNFCTYVAMILPAFYMVVFVLMVMLMLMDKKSTN